MKGGGRGKGGKAEGRVEEEKGERERMKAEEREGEREKKRREEIRVEEKPRKQRLECWKQVPGPVLWAPLTVTCPDLCRPRNRSCKPKLLMQRCKQFSQIFLLLD